MSSHDEPEEKVARRGRLDALLLALGHAPTREKARALIMTGRVAVNGRITDKPGSQVKPDAALTILSPPSPWVGRGGLKLEGALAAFAVEPADKVALDLGSSTGGFTQCLLQHEARRVYAVDVGRGILDWTLRTDPRVVVHEGVNARYLSRVEIPEPIAIAVADLAFISLRLVLPALVPLLAETADVLLLVKPQFELARGEVGKGVVRDPAKHAAAVTRVAEAAVAMSFRIRGLCPSPITGARGNREFFLWLANVGSELCQADMATTIAAVTGAGATVPPDQGATGSKKTR